LGKPYGINLRYYCECLKGTSWELGEPHGNTMRTRKKQKIPPPPTPPSHVSDGSPKVSDAYKLHNYLPPYFRPIWESPLVEAIPKITMRL